MTRFAGNNDAVGAFLGGTISPKYNKFGVGNIKNRSSQRQTNTAAEANVEMGGLDAMRDLRVAEHEARGIVAGGMADAAATRAQGMSGMFSGIAGGIGNMDFSGGSSGLAAGSISGGYYSTVGGTNPFSTDFNSGRFFQS